MIRTDLLRQLAEHLLHGKLGHARFDFTVYNQGFTTYNSCGTAGCAMGELPILFPDQWGFYWSDVYLKTTIYRSSFRGGMLFFDIDEVMYNHLFLPLRQNPNWGPTLDENATKEQVAYNILRFCELAENNKL